MRDRGAVGRGFDPRQAQCGGRGCGAPQGEGGGAGGRGGDLSGGAEQGPAGGVSRLKGEGERGMRVVRNEVIFFLVQSTGKMSFFLNSIEHSDRTGKY